MMEKDTIEQNYVELNGNKGIFTLNEVILILQSIGLKVKLKLHKNGDSRKVNGNNLRNS